MKNLRTRDKIAVVVAVLTVVSVSGSQGGAADILLGVGVNLIIVYGVAALLDFFKNRS